MSDNIYEIHLIIDWTNFFDSLNNKLNNNLTILHTLFIPTLNDRINIISAFYEQYVDDFRGKENFTLYIIKDTNPIYDFRNTSKGYRKVNINLFDIKKKLRNITGGYKIHATDNIQETKHNLKILGLFDKYYHQKKFINLNDVFIELNKYSKLQWLITHNFETFNQEEDIDFLTNDYFFFMRILDTIEKPKENKFNSVSQGKMSVRNYIFIGEHLKEIDIRYIGDNYYDKKFEIDLLNKRIIHPNAFYIPNKEYYINSLIYHSIIHKEVILPKYIKIFKKNGIHDEKINKKNLKDILDRFMKKYNYSYVKPESTVGYFYDLILDP
jgi:hypothetical protein